MKRSPAFAATHSSYTIKQVILSLLTVSLLAPLLVTAKAYSNPWQIRARAIRVAPDETSSTITVIGGKVDDISNETVPELDINYFFTPAVSLELILATAKHDVKASRTTLDVNGKTNLGSVRHLPPTLLLKYHLPVTKMFKPYVGAGVNYTTFYSEKASSNITSISYDNSYGGALSVGFDIIADKHWSFNADLKKIWISPDVKVVASGTTVKTSVDIDPLIWGLGVAYHF